MGDPKKRRKKFARPNHPWIKSRIVEEKEIKKKQGFKNKREMWKLDSKLKNFKNQTKILGALKTEQAEKEKELLFKKLKLLGMLDENSSPEDVLALTLDGVIERRLLNVVVNRKLAKSPKQARQFIVHKHITVKGKKITSPNYIVRVDEEDSIAFSESSKLSNPDHPERYVEKLTPEEKAEVAAERPKEHKADRRKDDRRHSGSRYDKDKKGFRGGRPQGQKGKAPFQGHKSDDKKHDVKKDDKKEEVKESKKEASEKKEPANQQ